METISAERETLRPKTGDDAARKRVAVETYAQNETTLRRTARRYSLCADDVEEALQRSLEILLGKAPSDDPLELIKWLQTVVKHEALAVRRERERDLNGPPSAPGDEDWVALLPAPANGPAEQVERREEIARSREALQALKPQELRALTLFGEGYSYVEIGEITNWSHTKINRCLAEGRERFRRLIAHSEAGGRCAELQPLLSSFCDGVASPEEVAELREHLRACVHCRATLRAYRLAPKAAAALVPFPLHRSLWERAQEAVSSLAGRFSGGGDPASQVATGGAGGGAVAMVKIAAVCIGTAGGAAACVAGGLVPGSAGGSPERPPQQERLAEAQDPAPTPQVEYEPAEAKPKPASESKSHRQPSRQQQPVEIEPAPSETVPVESAAVEAAPVAEPTPEPAPVESGGSPAGEFGP
ncbi:MAG TPA: zf-HC2 domain-containing protein [Solirubrobacterales bacterium]|nr:zf-HC2 domain-containing protein [Solirubrobacterales bacterium]